MKKFKKAVSLLMMSAMMILPVALPIQAKEAEKIENITADKNVAVTQSIPSGYNIKAKITGDNVNIRRYSGEIIGQLHKSEGDVVYLKDTSVTVVNGIPSRYCYSPKHSSYGYVSISYLKY